VDGHQPRAARLCVARRSAVSNTCAVVRAACPSVGASPRAAKRGLLAPCATREGYCWIGNLSGTTVGPGGSASRYLALMYVRMVSELHVPSSVVRSQHETLSGAERYPRNHYPHSRTQQREIANSPAACRGDCVRRQTALAMSVWRCPRLLLHGAAGLILWAGWSVARTTRTCLGVPDIPRGGEGLRSAVDCAPTMVRPVECHYGRGDGRGGYVDVGGGYAAALRVTRSDENNFFKFRSRTIINRSVFGDRRHANDRGKLHS